MAKMYSIKLFLLLLHIFLVSCDENQNYEALDSQNRIMKASSIWGIVKQIFADQWEQDRMMFLASGISEQVEISNCTVVAMQNVYDDQGNLKEVRTLELFFPKSINASQSTGSSVNLLNSASDEEEEEEEDEEHYAKKLSETLDSFEALSLTGMPMQLTVEKYNNDPSEELKDFVYLAHNFLGGFHQGLGYINETIEVSDKKVIDDYIKENSNKDEIPTIIIRRDVDGNFIPDQSVILPPGNDYAYQLINIKDMNIENKRMLVAATRAFTKAVYETPEAVGVNLVTEIRKEFPNYFWFVVTGDEDDVLELDDHVFITMEKDPIKMLDESESVTLIGIKMNTTS